MISQADKRDMVIRIFAATEHKMDTDDPVRVAAHSEVSSIKRDL